MAAVGRLSRWPGPRRPGQLPWPGRSSALSRPPPATPVTLVRTAGLSGQRSRPTRITAPLRARARASPTVRKAARSSLPTMGTCRDTFQPPEPGAREAATGGDAPGRGRKRTPPTVGFGILGRRVCVRADRGAPRGLAMTCAIRHTGPSVHPSRITRSPSDCDHRATSEPMSSSAPVRRLLSARRPRGVAPPGACGSPRTSRRPWAAASRSGSGTCAVARS